MLTHAQIWFGIDALAERCSLTPSGLARRAGLDPTTFNPSKRFTDRGTRPRWPSTESIAKALAATGTSFQEFALLASGDDGPVRALPLRAFDNAGAADCFDAAGFPAGGGWEATPFPDVCEAGAYALEIRSDSMAPPFREGARIIVSPGQEVRRGDRVLVKTMNGEVIARELGRVSSRRIELVSLNPARLARSIDVSDIAWIARVIWASQ